MPTAQELYTQKNFARNNAETAPTVKSLNATDAAVGSDASKALAVQGVTGGKPVSISSSSKLSLTGFTSTAATNTNLLDGTGSGVATDVTAFNSALLTIVSTATTGSYTVQGAFNSGFTIGVQTLQLFEATSQASNPLNTAIVPTITTRTFLLNLQGVNFIRVNMTSGAAGVTPYISLSQAPHIPNQFNVQQFTATSLQANVTSTTGLALALSSTFGASTHFTLVSAASTNLTSIKASVGTLNTFKIDNTSASWRWVKVFNALTGSVTLGSTIPVLNFGVAPNSPINVDCGTYGIRLTTAVTIAITGGSALLDNTAISAGDVIISTTYN